MRSIYVRIVLLPVSVYLVVGAVFYYSMVKPGYWEALEFLKIFALTGVAVLAVSAYVAYQITRQIIDPLRFLLEKLQRFPKNGLGPYVRSRIPEIEGIRQKSEDHLNRLKKYIGDLNLEKELLQTFNPIILVGGKAKVIWKGGDASLKDLKEIGDKKLVHHAPLLFDLIYFYQKHRNNPQRINVTELEGEPVIT